MKTIGLFFALSMSFLNFAQADSTQKEQISPKEILSVKCIAISDPVDYKNIAQDLITTARNDAILGVLLTVDSNGGATNEFAMLHDLIQKIREKKPVVVMVNASACSGGYLVASAADHIVAYSASCIGSIGIIHYVSRESNVKLAEAKYTADVTAELIIAGKFKGLLSPSAPSLNKEQRQYLAANTQKAYQFFLETIARNRNLNIKESGVWAEGKVFNGQEALKIGLIDQIGTIFEAEEKLTELLRMKYKDIKINF